MGDNLESRAHQSANMPYTIEVEQDETTEGEPIYVLSHPELPGCIAQGENWQEALDNLRDATFEYILSLLVDGLPIPEPHRNQGVITSNMTTTTSVTVFGSNLTEANYSLKQHPDYYDEGNIESIRFSVEFRNR